MKNLIGLLFFVPALSFAGPNTSGGGMAVTCAGTDGDSASTQFLDYFEAVAMHGQEDVMRASGDYRSDYVKMVRRTHRLQGYLDDLVNQDDIDTNLTNFFSRVEWVHSSELPFLGDHGNTVSIPDNCELRQMIIYHDKELPNPRKIQIAEDLWNELDSANQATAIQHEIWYVFERLFGEIDSRSARSYVHQILAADNYTSARDGVANATWDCHTVHREFNYRTKVYSFFVVPRNDGISFQFQQIAGRSMLVKSVSAFEFDFDVKLGEYNNVFLRHLVEPADVTARQNVTVNVDTAHREGLQMKLKFKAGEPVTVQGILNGIPLSRAAPVSCRIAE